SGMRTGETDVRTRDRGHADEVIRAREERREGRREWHEADDLHPDRHRDHPLLCDVHLEEAIGGGLLEIFGVGRIAHIGVERPDERARSYASSICERSWPSITIPSRPNAFTRDAYASVSHSSSVGPR